MKPWGWVERQGILLAAIFWFEQAGTIGVQVDCKARKRTIMPTRNPGTIHSHLASLVRGYDPDSGVMGIGLR